MENQVEHWDNIFFFLSGPKTVAVWTGSGLFSPSK